MQVQANVEVEAEVKSGEISSHPQFLEVRLLSFELGFLFPLQIPIRQQFLLSINLKKRDVFV